MTSPRGEKLKIVNTILAFLGQNLGVQSRKMLVSSIKLQSGFTQKVVDDIISDLVVIKKVVVNGDEIELFR